ncbi:trifunctional serine/threonine-protein kinase/ATP-binding protein/sensor histidine kinase [Nostoc sp. NZL]|uniref:trifunctional serine/threonine-protein kinase/ATP-binding protein/sensor histidine kinase n=1 Tax=Nostoc sp. NZL TaxID=2650612 RepID=UPI0018C7EBE2|nr:ATP-binding sensor histidine kinase [Nostoc sp. NZL]MBG1240299.1 AAA family ATPase [Nostoc sp. NZL]
MVTTLVTIPGYQVNEQLYNGSRTIVYRGYRETDSLPVVIKLLKNPYPSFSELVQFRNQYTITKNINSPLIIQTYSLEPYQNSYALVMEDFGGISLKEWGTGENLRNLTEFLQIAIALCNTLDILYCARIIHKDIKPANILINPETKQVKLIDFSIASLLPRESQTLMNPNVLEGTLSYISPEQTGRMNRGIDYRADFYSLGVTFYELLTGELPFQSNDPMELVHCHLAKLPANMNKPRSPLAPPPCQGEGWGEVSFPIPQVLCNIVMKLMAKNAEDRYQSALGLKFDLENCLSQIQETGEIKSFPIAQRDVCDRFIIPDKLYGRETEIEILLQAFERVSLGATEMMLVAGFSGIGKTAVVNEIHKPIVRQRGYFIKGKFDQFQRKIPLSALVQAFRDFMKQLLTESDGQIQQWKSKILEAVGENGQVIIEVIPELERIIGQQPSPPELSENAAQIRFNLIFQKFTQVFTTAEHPLVMFLDDLQWADLASLKLMQLLMADTGHLLLIGAYRDNEVKKAHPLILTLGEIEKTQATINTITLAPLSQRQVNQLIADTLKCSEDLALPLSLLVSQKTQGNPFFATQFIKVLHQDRLIQFNFESGFWECDIAQLTTLAVTDDVVAFMAFQLQRLPQSTQNILQLAACIGNQFDLATLAIVSESSEIETAADLWKALEEGLLLTTGDVYKFFQHSGQDSESKPLNSNFQVPIYKFLHDRVQQAAYSLIPEAQKQTTHLKLGQILLNNISKSEKEEKIFQIVSQLNLGLGLITQQIERDQLAQLNLLAGRKAIAATAYTAAIEYLTLGMELLTADSWQSHYDLTLALYEDAAKAEYLNTSFEEAIKLTDLILQQTTQMLDRIKAYELKVQIYIAQDQQVKAIETGLKALEQLNISLRSTDVEQENRLAQLPTLTKLADIPEMTNLESLAALRLLISITPPVHHVKPDMFPSVALTKLHLCLEQGHSSLAAFAYGSYGVFLCAVIGDVDTAYYSSQIALKLLEQYQSKEISSKIYMIFGVFICAYKEHGRNTLTALRQSIQCGLEVGDIEHASYSMMAECTHLFLIGETLDTIEERQAKYIDLLLKFKQKHCVDYAKIWRQVTLNLLGQSSHQYYLTGIDFDETGMLPHLHNTHNHQSLFAIYLAKTAILYTFDQYEQAASNAEKATEYMDGAFGLLLVVAHNLYYSLCLLANYSSCDREQNQQECWLNQVITNQKLMHYWAGYAPVNFQHKYDLVEAETARVMGDKLKAMEYYDRAISLAKANGYIQEEALSNELAAKFYLDWGKEKVAQAYMQEAYYCYARWGAKAKTNDLEKRYPQLLQPILEQQRINLNPLETISFRGTSSSTRSSSTDSTCISDGLDFTSVLKAAQAISSSLELDQLIASLTRIILENSGAKKSALILPQGDTWQVRATTFINHGSNSQIAIQTILDSQPLDTCQDIPITIINYVKNTQQTVVIDNLQTDIPGVIGEYMHRIKPQSVLCTPIINQGHLVGILYLENQLTQGVFTSDRLSVINLLSSQAAISLENAQLYTNLQDTEARFHRLAENVPGMIYQFQLLPDGITRLSYVSTGCYEIYEVPSEQAVADANSLISLTHPEDMVRYQETITISAQTLEPWLYQGRIITLSGQLKWIQAASRPIKQADGSIIWDGLLLDVTERKQAEAAVIQKSQELKKALEELQQAQLQMVQSEKMSALGNLVAGVAHEMNNPLGFIAASLKQTKPTIADIVEHLKLYQASLPNPDDQIKEHAEEIDLDYSLEDLPKIIDSMTMACDRLHNISTSLRTFSRADKDYKVPFNIHEGIDSTILILKHRLKANEERPTIEVITDYGNLPQFLCFPGQLNQVFMNIMANAIDALDESNTGRSFEEIKDNPNRIIIKTSVANQGVKISIADNGNGINEEVKQKIFDHLFTTKGVGKGTGLGLAIARQIVAEKHGGVIEVNSTPGEGTEFVVTLPIEANFIA